MTGVQIVELGIQVRLQHYKEIMDVPVLNMASIGWASWSVSGYEYRHKMEGKNADKWTLGFS